MLPEDTDEIASIARQAMNFKNNLNKKLQRQEENERRKSEMKLRENKYTPGAIRELKRFDIK